MACSRRCSLARLCVTGRTRRGDGVNSKRISDLLVGVEHDSDLGADGSWWQILFEDGADGATGAVRAGNLAPDGLIAQTCLLALETVDVRDALSVVELARVAIVAVLDFQKRRVVLLRALAASEARENRLLVESAKQNARPVSN